MQILHYSKLLLSGEMRTESVDNENKFYKYHCSCSCTETYVVITISSVQYVFKLGQTPCWLILGVLRFVDSVNHQKTQPVFS